MKSILSILSASLIFAGASVCQAALIAAWDFAGLAAAPSTPSTIPRTVGNGSIDVSAFASTVSTPQRTSFGGTSTVNAFAGGEAVTGTSLALANSSANGFLMTLSVDTSGQQNIVLTYATQRTTTGFTSQDWKYSTDGGATFSSTFATISSIPSSFGLETVDFSSVTALNDNSQVVFQLMVDGASGSTGNNRFDNFQINATPVPEPVTWALIVFGGLVGAVQLGRLYRRHLAAC